MKILVTGANGFVAKNLLATVRHLPNMEIWSYEKESTQKELEKYCKEADFVFHLAGVNRPKDPEEFMRGNFGFTSILLDTLKRYENKCPVILSSSVQAALTGRFVGSKYGESKLAGENLLIKYGQETGAKVFIYRFPNLFGKWCRPNYNSAVATFCYNIANDLPVQVNDRATELDLVYIDNVVEELLLAMQGGEHRNNAGYCYVPEVHTVTLGEIIDLLEEFKASRQKRTIPDMTEGAFSKKLYATYLSYLAPDNLSYPLQMHIDQRGSFTEILRTKDRGQFSVNISRPGITKGGHWHHSKNEKFVVVAGCGLIQLRKIGIDEETGKPFEIVEYRVNGKEMTVVEVVPGYTHNIINTSDTVDLVTFMWCNECFDASHPDTLGEEVVIDE